MGVTKAQQKAVAKYEAANYDKFLVIFLPLMRNSIAKEKLAVKSVNLAKTISDKAKQNACIASIFAFASKYLDENIINTLLEVLRMTDLATLLVEDAVQDAKYAEKTVIAKNMLKDRLSLSTIEKYTGLDITTIKCLQIEINNEQ